MFTGLVLTTASVKKRMLSGASGKLVLAPDIKLDNLEKGESIAVNGACLTLEKEEHGLLSFHVLAETFKRTNLGTIAVGGIVNIERAMQSGSRFGGHIVQGHVDTVSEILRIGKEGSDMELEIALPEDFQPFAIEKGSITIDGISLTLVDVKSDSCSVRIIPHTWNGTNLRTRKKGDIVNIETDLLAKYVQKQLSAIMRNPGKSNINMDTLRNAGW